MGHVAEERYTPHIPVLSVRKALVEHAASVKYSMYGGVASQWSLDACPTPFGMHVAAGMKVL